MCRWSSVCFQRGGDKTRNTLKDVFKYKQNKSNRKKNVTRDNN